MVDARIIVADAETGWVDRQWNFRIYALLSEGGGLQVRELIDVVKPLFRRRVAAMIDPGEATRRGFAICTAVPVNRARVQIYWWTEERALHRVAVVGCPRARRWERLPPWEIGNAREIAVIAREIAGLGGQPATRSGPRHARRESRCSRETW